MIHLLTATQKTTSRSAVSFGKNSSMSPITTTWFRCLITGSILSILIMLSPGCTRNKQEGKTESNKSSEMNASKKTKSVHKAKEALIMIRTEADFRKYVLKADMPCLADFFSMSCPPCRMLSPTIKKLAEEYKGKAIVCEVSLDSPARNLARQYRIYSIPAVLFFDKGKEKQRVVGLHPKSAYSNILDKMINSR